MVKKFYNPNKQNLGLYLYTCGNEDCHERFNVAPHTRRDYLLHYIIKGEGLFEENGNIHKVGKGDVFSIFPGEIVSYRSTDRNNPWSFCWIGIMGDEAEKYLENSGITRDNRVIHLNNMIFFETVVNMLKYVESAENVSDVKINSMVLNCLYSIEKSVKKQEREINEYAVSKAIGFIEDNYMHSITVGDIVNYVKLDRTYFYRLFKKETRRSPEQFLMEYRIEQACRLIYNGGYPLGQIAEYVGLSSPQYFTKLFKRIKGITPSEFLAKGEK